ncbi:MAG: hypothetical protein NVS2B9_13070 [Myxococcales bacterium]
MTPFPRLVAPALLFTCAAASAGCGSPVRRELTVSWTFGGLTCAQAGIARIQVQIPGEVLSPDTFACSAGAGQVTTGADLGGFLRGAYTVTVSGLDPAGAVVAQLSQAFRIDGSADAHLALDVPLTTLTVRWTFAGRSCAAAGNPIVQVTLDGQPLTDAAGSPNLPCAQRAFDGSLQDGIAIAPLDARTHTFGFTAFVNGSAAYSLQGFTAAATPGQDVVVAPDLAAVQATAATASVRWTFAGLSCAEGQVSTVRVDVDGVRVGELPCTGAGGDGGAITGLAEGTHALRIIGFRAAGASSTTVYESGPVSAGFYVGKSTYVPIDAAPSAPAVGEATLTFAVAAGGPACTGSGPTVTSTLTSPAGGKQTFSGPCGNPLVFCDSRLGPCPAGALPGLAPGVWTIAATAPGAGRTYAAGGTFAVANQAQQGYTLTLQ